MSIAGRDYARVYGVERRQDLHAFLVAAVQASGGRVLYASDPRRVPPLLARRVVEQVVVAVR